MPLSITYLPASATAGVAFNVSVQFPPNNQLSAQVIMRKYMCVTCSRQGVMHCAFALEPNAPQHMHVEPHPASKGACYFSVCFSHRRSHSRKDACHIRRLSTTVLHLWTACILRSNAITNPLMMPFSNYTSFHVKYRKAMTHSKQSIRQMTWGSIQMQS